jgi:hypothetical protein
MPGFSRVAEIADAALAGAGQFSTWRKSPTQATTQGLWFDLSMSPGNPVPQYYAAAPMISIALARSTDGGLNHGGNVAPLNKYLRKTMAMATVATALPMPMILCDYLLFYPFVDEGTVGVQPMTNIVTLPRYADGAGVQMMAVSVASRSGGASFSVSYTNQAGVSGRTTAVVIENSALANGTIVTSATAASGAAGPFIPLQAGDSGVRRIDSITMSGSDVGLFSLVLVQPLAQTQIRGIDAPVEVDYLLDRALMPRIYDDAFLNWICLPNGAINATALHGSIETVWN